MNDAQPQRRFQFSLRKLMLWMAVLAAYLGLLRLINADVILALITICWLTVIVAVRLRWGARRARFIAIAGTGLCVGVGFAATMCIVAGQSRPAHNPFVGIIVYMPVVVAVGAFIGLCVSDVAELSLHFVNFLDGLLRPKTPHDDTGESNS